MEKVWFVYIHDQVKGPLSTEEAEEELSRVPANQGLVWSRGLSGWVSHDKWQKSVPTKSSQSVATSYYVDIQGENIGPLTLQQLVDRVRYVNDLDAVRLWSAHRKRWQSLFEDGDVCAALGVTRRGMPRVPLAGSAIVQKDNVQFVAPIISISLGGIGICLESAPKINGTVVLTLRSPSLFNTIKTRAEVAYQKADGTIGFKFVSLSMENQSAIIEYIRTFEQEQNRQAA